MSDTAEDPNPASLANLEPAFAPGNTLALKHGAYSPAFVREAAVPIVEMLYALAPWLEAPEFLPSVANYAEQLATATLLAGMVERITAEKGAEKVPSRTWEQLTAARRLVHQMGNDFGLTPQGRARLAATATAADVGRATLADLKAQGRQTTGYQANAGHDEDEEL